MTRGSTSPPRLHSRESRNTERYEPRRTDRNNEAPGRIYDERRKHHNEGDATKNHYDRRDDRNQNGRSYRERDRELERTRDRARYDKEYGEGDNSRSRDRAGPSSRRSASPRPRDSRARSGRPSSKSRSRSPSLAVKIKPNFAPSGLLAAETNTVKAVDGNSTVLKYNEPPEARKPVLGWRLYVFKGSEQVELLHIHRQSAYLIGRDRLVADIAVDHPSCSKQHAVIQYRWIQEKDEFGASKGVIKPFIIDLESTNGTHVNDEAIPVSRYYELKASDVIKFGQSTREYVLLHDGAT